MLTDGIAKVYSDGANRISKKRDVQSLLKTSVRNSGERFKQNICQGRLHFGTGIAKIRLNWTRRCRVAHPGAYPPAISSAFLGLIFRTLRSTFVEALCQTDAHI